MAQTRLYFAYGENMNLGRLKKWLFQRGGRPDGITSVQHAVLSGYRIVFNARREIPWKAGVANLQEDKKGKVEGILMEIDPGTENLIQKKEGIPAAAKRIDVSVVGDKEKTYDRVFTFVSIHPEEGKTHAPAKAYMDLVLQAARDFEFSAPYVKALEKITTSG
ncbi:MAG: gamma-glutamylcyclotransferase family protein [Planctomycetota bacterium]|jgi:hypothetical protein